MTPSKRVKSEGSSGPFVARDADGRALRPRHFARCIPELAHSLGDGVDLLRRRVFAHRDDHDVP